MLKALPIIRSLSGEKGQDMAEYALLIGLLAMFLIVAVGLLAQDISSVFNHIATILTTWVT